MAQIANDLRLKRVDTLCRYNSNPSHKLPTSPLSLIPKSVGSSPMEKARSKNYIFSTDRDEMMSRYTAKSLRKSAEKMTKIASKGFEKPLWTNFHSPEPRKPRLPMQNLLPAITSPKSTRSLKPPVNMHVDNMRKKKKKEWNLVTFDRTNSH